MRKGLLFLGALTMLAGCFPVADPANNSAVPTPVPTDTPVPWLTADPICSGTITRAEWLVCDNPTLNDLHRRLAQEWQTARQYASDQRMQVLQDQLYALLSERDACQDVNCIATAYRRYLSVQPPAPKPPVTPKPKPKPKWHQRHGHWRDRQDWEPRGAEQSCAAAIGPAAAAHLSHQCDAVTSGPPGMCSVRRSCDSLQGQIEHGCRESYRKPPFCRP